MTSHIYTRVQAKARARQIKAESEGTLSLAAALEEVAREMGFRDWNTASARLSNAPDTSWQVGDRVRGHYLNRAFTGRIHGVRELQAGSGYEVTIHFDAAVDVVEWDSFSAHRQRVTALVSPEGVSWAKTSDGVPHLVVAPESALLV
ncbi:MAG: glyoxalase superfamily protein [Pseudomonadota bacterium]|nr:glyoxalase superfamily protein [Pseudomonadota bacterium]